MSDMTQFDLDRLFRLMEADRIDEVRERQRKRWLRRDRRRWVLQAAIIILALSVIPLAVLVNEILGR